MVSDAQTQPSVSFSFVEEPSRVEALISIECSIQRCNMLHCSTDAMTRCIMSVRHPTWQTQRRRLWFLTLHFRQPYNWYLINWYLIKKWDFKGGGWLIELRWRSLGSSFLWFLNHITEISFIPRELCATPRDKGSLNIMWCTSHVVSEQKHALATKIWLLKFQSFLNKYEK